MVEMKLNSRKSELEEFIGTPVRIDINSRSPAMGIVEKVSSEYVSLKPSLVPHGFYSNKGKLIDDYIIQTEISQKIKISNICRVEPLKKGYIEKLAKNVNDLQPKENNSKK